MTVFLRDRKSWPQVATLPGTLRYPRVNAPDFKFKKEFGEFSTKVVLTGDAAERFIRQYDEFYDEAYEAVRADEGKKKLKIKNDKSWKVDVDDDDEEIEGQIVLNCKKSGGGKNRETGETYKNSITLVDASGKPVKGVEVWGGTKARVSLKLRPYFNEAVGFGVALDLQGVKILDLVTRGERSADSLGFGGEEDGFSGDDNPTGDDPPHSADDKDSGGKHEF